MNVLNQHNCTKYWITRYWIWLYISGKLPLDDVISDYLKLCIEYDTSPSIAKYCVQMMLRELQETPRGKKFLECQTLDEIWYYFLLSILILQLFLKKSMRNKFGLIAVIFGIWEIIAGKNNENTKKGVCCLVERVLRIVSFEEQMTIWRVQMQNEWNHQTIRVSTQKISLISVIIIQTKTCQRCSFMVSHAKKTLNCQRTKRSKKIAYSNR